VGVRASTGGRFAPGGANGGRRGMVADARACEERPGRVFIHAGGWLGGSWGQPRRRCTHGVGSKVRQRAAERWPNGVRWLARRRVGNCHLAPSKRSRTPPTVALPAWRMDRWVRRCIGVRAQCAYGGLALCARRRVRARSGVARWKQFADALFKIVFLWISKL
jgi:hypothetical protein